MLGNYLKFKNIYPSPQKKKSQVLKDEDEEKVLERNIAY